MSLVPPVPAAAATRAPGRPLDAARHAAILNAAFELLGEVGYERLTIEAVALRAGTSKATVYRRWPGKAPLVVEALKARTPDPGWEDTGSLRGDLLCGLARMAAFLDSGEGRVAIGLTWAMQEDAVLASALRGCVLDSKGAECDRLVTRAVGRGEISDPGSAAALVPMTIFGLLHARVAVGGLPADPEFIAAVVDRVLLPILGITASTHAPNDPLPRPRTQPEPTDPQEIS